MLRPVARARFLVGALALLPSALLSAACPPPTPPPPPPVVFGETNGIAACDTATVEAHPDARCHTYRGLGGVSMGGGTASRLGFAHPELYDVVGIMGTPFADNEFFFGMLETNHLTGFCPLADLEALMAQGVDLDDDEDPRLFCGTHDVFPLEGGDQVSHVWPAVEGSRCWMFRSDYHHWYRGPDEGRGGSFSRNSLIDIIHDLVAAYGNPLSYNPESAYLPPGVPDSWHVPPRSGVDPAARCADPVVLQGVYNREYNPDGAYPVVTFCDGASTATGNWDPDDPGARSRVVEFAVAVDLNGNGRRDWAEPIVVNNRERWRDLGDDGVASVDEPGYDAAGNPDPAGDDWDPMTNPAGKESNLRRDEGEAFDDDGLDGVPGTGDYGEGNEIYDVNPNLERIFDRGPGRYFRAMPESQVRRIDVWMDAGIRDFLNTAQISNALFSELKKRIPDARVYDNFDHLPGAVPGQGFYYSDADYSRAAMGQLAYLRYGDPAICPGSDDVLGDGNHVGPEVVDRLLTLFAFLSARIPAEGRDEAIGGTIEDLESPTGQLVDFGFTTTYDSEVLGRDVQYGVVLPPDYYLSDRQEQEYPVLYFFHGQGQSASDMVAAGLILWTFMKESRSDRIATGKTDLQRAILVFVDGECHEDECYTGNFYADFEGLPRPDRRFEAAFYELVRHVDATYRTKSPALVRDDG